MKKILAAVLAGAAVLLSGCSAPLPQKDNSEKILVVTTIFPAYDMARAVFGDTAQISLLLKPGMESHSYDPSARDIVTIGECDLFVYNGGESDSWVENILASVDEVDSFRMMECVQAIEEEVPEGMQHNEDEHSHESETDEEYDEHIWTSPKNALLILEGISAKAQALFPENAQLYKERAAAYAAEITEIDRDFEELFANEERLFIFGDRFPLQYFFREYGLNYSAAFPGCGSEVEPSAQTVTYLLEKLGDSDTVPAVFCIELSNKKLAQTLAEETGLPVVEFHACHNITADDFAAGETWASLMKRNYNALSAVLGQG